MDELEYFDYGIDSEIEMLDEERKKIKKKSDVGKILMIIGFLSFFFTGFVGAIAFIFGLIIIIISQKQFKNLVIQSNLFEKIVNKILPESIISIEEGITEYNVKESGLEYLYNRYHSDFLVEGNYKNVNYSCSNVLIQHYSSNGKSSSTTTHFEGVIYEFDFEKNLDVCLKVFEKKDTHLKNGLFKVETESILFNEKFKVYSDDETKTFYVLTPNIQELMLKIEEAFPGKVEFSYVNGKMFIGIESNEIGFDFKINKSISENFDYIEKQFSLIHKFIDAFKLSTAKYTEAKTLYSVNENVNEDMEINNGWGSN